ncbi:MAG: response regulator [Desulfocapsaceae bacterium]|nr:response regulator [Desulfocapsaceae bacterium]
MAQFWKKLGITAKFAASFGIFLVLLLMIAITGYLALRYVRSAEKTIQASTEIETAVIEMENAMEKARRLHGDFFLHYPLIGFTKAHDLYVRQSAEQIARVIQNSTKLQEIYSDAGIRASRRSSHVNLNLYIASAKRFSDTSAESIALIKELADPMDGLEILFQRATTALQDETAVSMHLEELGKMMTASSKDYLLTHQRHFMQSSFNTLAVLQKAVENETNLQKSQRRKILTLLSRWKEIADKIVEVDIKKSGIINDFSLQTEATDAAALILIKQAKQDVGEAQLRISQAHTYAVGIMAVISLTGLILAAIIARVLNRSITRNIIDLTNSAREFQQGNLHVAAGPEGPDELGELARSFNAMSIRIRGLVDNLEQKVVERTAELAESEKRFRTIIEHTPQGILIADRENLQFLYANPAIAMMLGYDSPLELIGKNVTDIHPEQNWNTIQLVFRRTAPEPRFLSDTLCLRKNGTTFYADIVGGDLRYADTACRIGFFRDTTEKRNLQGQLERARKMEAIGLLAGGVAHDLNNILSGIISYPELLLLQIPEDSALRRPLHAIQESGQRAAAVVSDLLTVARGVASTREVANLNTIILEYLASPEHMEIRASHSRITCREHLDPHIARISCSPIHIKKCILNLVINAMDAIIDGGSVTISTCNRKVAGEEFRDMDVLPGNYVVLTIADTGHGIKEEDLNHIFEPFYTKKIMGKSGTGLGLAVVWNSMQDHGGSINVETGAKGTAFHLFFPATNKQVQAQNAQATLDQLRGNGEILLIVDDEPQQLDIAGRILETLNYQVHCAGSGEAAVAYMKEGRADLILLDMVMDPGMNGLETFEEILRIHPGQKAIIVSGFAESNNIRMVQTLGAGGFIKKPYSIEQLGMTVRNCLHENGSGQDSP